MSTHITNPASGNIFNRTTVLGLLVSFLTPASLLADEQTAIPRTDVILHANGTLRGSVVDNVGRPMIAAKVQVLHDTQVVASAITDESGRFSVQSLRNGTHVLQTDSGSLVIRIWTKAAAPPTASDNITVVARPNPLVRGQAASTDGMPGNPWFIAGAVGVAVGAILIYEDQNDDGSKRRAPRVASP